MKENYNQMKNNNRKLKFFAGFFHTLYILFWICFVLKGLDALINLFFDFHPSHFSLDLASGQQIDTSYQWLGSSSVQGVNDYMEIVAKFDNNSLGFRIFQVMNTIIRGGCGVLILYFAKNIFQSLYQSVKNGNPFLYENTLRIRKSAWLMLFLGIYNFSLSAIFSLFIIDKFKIGEQALSLHPSINIINTVIFSIILLIIAEIYSAGVKMREDVDFTI